MKRTVLVTGGTGHVGTNAVDYLSRSPGTERLFFVARNKHKLQTLYNNTIISAALGESYPELIYRSHDVMDVDATAELIREVQPDVILNMAAGRSEFPSYYLKKKSTGEFGDKDVNSFIRYLTDIEIQARRCKAIVQNLLRFSRSRRETEFDDVNVNAIIEDTVTFVEHQLHMNQIELKLEVDADLPIIQGNPGQLQQVFTNLIINAMHASAPETCITIKSRYSPALGEFGGAVELQFIDQGSGIEPENINKIFEPFFSTKEVGKGTGLGLFMMGFLSEGQAAVKEEVSDMRRKVQTLLDDNKKNRGGN